MFQPLRLRKFGIIEILSIFISFSSLQAGVHLASCFEPTEAGQKALSIFLRHNTNHTLKPYLRHFCDPKEMAIKSHALAALDNIRADGQSKDWPIGSFTFVDKRDNVEQYDKTKPATGAYGHIDLLQFNAFYAGDRLFLTYVTANKSPASDVTYWLQLYDAENQRLYDFIFGETSYVNLYSAGKYQETKPLSADEVQFKHGALTEVIFNAKNFALPPQLRGHAVVFSATRNLVNSTSTFILDDLAQTRIKSAAQVLTHISDVAVADTGTLPLAIALSESFAYENSTPDIQVRVLNDARTLYTYAQTHAFDFSILSFEAQLAWSNRSMMWGGLAGLYLDTHGKINAEAYDFMFLSPARLPEIRNALEANGIDANWDDEKIFDEIDKFALAKNRYRWKPDEVCRWAEVYPEHADFQRLCIETRNDTANGGQIMTVNGKPIYIWAIMAPNYQWFSIRTNGFFFGPCGDVAVVTMAGLKAFGIADFALFRKLGETDDFTHTFAGFYDKKRHVWRSITNQLPQPNQKGTFTKPYLQFSLPISSPAMPVWHKLTGVQGVVFWINERSPVHSMSFSEMVKKLKVGFTNKEIRKLITSENNSISQGETQTNGLLFNLSKE
ncbi:MAG TPA: hypothetical protein PLY93_06155 [Turneriella sp.]|nr:hypothetical protein [Turneriella sp.]